MIDEFSEMVAFFGSFLDLLMTSQVGFLTSRVLPISMSVTTRWGRNLFLGQK